MAKKLIAVVPLWDDEKESIWMLPGYMNGIEAAGGIPIILPLAGDVQDALEAFARCDGLLLTGGHDIAPSLYRQQPGKNCGLPCGKRDTMEPALYASALEHDKPVLGICRGIQLINVLQGGTLYQDLPTELDSSVEHHMAPPYTNAAHQVTVRRGTPLHALLQTEGMGVNSYHHQAVKALGADLEVMAVSEDGLVEAVRHTGKPFVWGFQWHPEFDYQVNPSSRRIFEAFLWPDQLMRIFTPEEELIAIGAGYLRIVSFSYLFSSISQCYLMAMKISGYASMSVWISAVTVVVDVTADIFLVYGFGSFQGLGANGSAYSTIAVEVIVLVWCIL